MSDGSAIKLSDKPEVVIEKVTGELSVNDMNDLCDATDAAIASGGGFGWVKLPARDIMERYWHGVITIPTRTLLVSRLDGVICGTAILIAPPKNNEAQNFAVQLTSLFVTPWARRYGVASKLLEKAEEIAIADGFSVINLDVRETQKAAISLYEARGFKEFGRNPYYARVDGKIIAGRYYTKIINPEIVV